MNLKCKNLYKLKSRGLSYRYTIKGMPSVPALKNINISNIQSGEICFIVGPNGSGKSTLLNILAGRIPLTSQNGEFIFFENETVSTLPDLRPYYIPQTPFWGNVENFTIYENLILRKILLDKRKFNIASKIETHEDVKKFLNKYSSSFFINKLDLVPANLSGGQVQILNFLSVLYAKPKIILMDEPTSKLDEKHRVLFMSIISQAMYDFDLMIICVTHDYDMVNRIGNRIIYLENGQLKKEELIRQVDDIRAPGEIRYVKSLKELPQEIQIVPHDWWSPSNKRLFSDSYFLGDDSDIGYLANQPLSRFERTEREVNGIIRLLELINKTDKVKILDVPCGWGRHSSYLTDQGFDIIGVDINPSFIKQIKNNKGIFNFILGDMRYLPLANESIDIAINMWTSFGFFENESNLDFLREINRVLKKGGLFLIHTDLNPRRIREGIFDEPSVRKLKNGYLCVKEYYCAEEKSIYGSWHVSSCDHNYTYKIKLYDEDEWILMAKKTGFKLKKFYGSFDGQTNLTARSQEFIILLQKIDSNHDYRKSSVTVNWE